MRLWRLMVVFGVVALAAASLQVPRQDAEADIGFSCTLTELDGTVTLVFGGQRGSSENLRRDGDWEATVTGLGALRIPDGAGSSYVVRIRGAFFDIPYSEVPCVAEGAPPPPPAPPDVFTCIVTSDGPNTRVVFDGPRGISENLRRNGAWEATVTGLAEITVAGGAGDAFSVRVRGDGFATPFSTFDCTPPPAVSTVVHISIDGLRPDWLTPTRAPHLFGLTRTGATTLNARNDAGHSRTLPNHLSQLTGWPVSAHGVTFNDDNLDVVHSYAGTYVPSVFDVVHDHGLRTAALVTKSKFDFVERSWDAANGAPDLEGVDDGTDKIDIYFRGSPDLVAAEAVSTIEQNTADYVFVHFRNPDSRGHASAWGSPDYSAAVLEVDGYVDDILDAIATSPLGAMTTTVIITSDHGGSLGGFTHDDITDADNYTIPFLVAGAGVGGGDLYALNPTTRTDPANTHPVGTGTADEPIRGADAANLALQLLGLPAVPGSVYNAAQDLSLG